MKTRSREDEAELGSDGIRGDPAPRGSDEAWRTPHREIERGPDAQSVPVDNSRSDVAQKRMLNSHAMAGDPTGKDPGAEPNNGTRHEEPTDAPHGKSPHSSPASVHSFSSPSSSSSADSNTAGQLLSREFLAVPFDPTPLVQQQCRAQDQSLVLAQRPIPNPTNAGFVSKTPTASQLAGPPLGIQGPGAAAQGSHGQPGGGENPPTLVHEFLTVMREERAEATRVAAVVAAARVTAADLSHARLLAAVELERCDTRDALGERLAEKPVSDRGVGSPSAPGSAWCETTSVPQAPGWPQDGCDEQRSFDLDTLAMHVVALPFPPVQGRGGPGTSKDMVPVPNTQALVFCSTEPRGDNSLKDEFPPLPGALGDMVPPLRNPALMHNDTTQRGDGSSKDEPFPSSGLAATPITVPPDAASGKLGPEQREDDFSGVFTAPTSGTPQNPIYMDLGRVPVQAEQIRVDCVPEQLWDDFSKHHIDGKAQAAHTILVLPPGTCGVRPGNLPLVATGATDGRFRRRPRGLSLEA